MAAVLTVHFQRNDYGPEKIWYQQQAFHTVYLKCKIDYERSTSLSLISHCENDSAGITKNKERKLQSWKSEYRCMFAVLLMQSCLKVILCMRVNLSIYAYAYTIKWSTYIGWCYILPFLLAWCTPAHFLLLLLQTVFTQTRVVQAESTVSSRFVCMEWLVIKLAGRWLEGIWCSFWAHHLYANKVALFLYNNYCFFCTK